MAKRRRPTAPAKKPSPSIKTLVLPRKHVGHVVVPAGMIPAIVPGRVPHEVAIIPVRAEPQKQSWMDFLFGTEKKSG